jgi:ATP-dependent Clp protease adaptor protein ClpS
MPATLPQTLPRVGPGTGTGTGTEDQDSDSPLFRVVLLDDNEHTYEYVIEMLCRIFFMSTDTAYKHACEVDAEGRTVVMVCERDQAEFGRDQIHAYGADPRMAVSKGSMSAVVEPAGQAG